MRQARTQLAKQPEEEGAWGPPQEEPREQPVPEARGKREAAPRAEEGEAWKEPGEEGAEGPLPCPQGRSYPLRRRESP